jgi:hypothetical protein
LLDGIQPHAAYLGHCTYRITRYGFLLTADFTLYLPVLSRLLVRHAHVMERLRREIASVLEDGPIPSRQQIRRTPYLACVIKESEFKLFV